jgi:carbon monoxide dehydrogenase subunit G/molybdopterin biosynthesis enzyme
MRFEGKVTIRATRERVWGFLTDPEQVGACAPGVESIEVVEPGKRFRATASVGFGTVKTSFVTEAEWVDVYAPALARMKVHGTAPGSAVDAVTEMALADGAEGTTELLWAADVAVVGAIASLAARLMGGVTQKLTAAFFEVVRQKIEAQPPAPAAFRFGPVPLAEATGKILGHNVTGADGRPLLRKGRPLRAEDLAALRALGRTTVYVAEPGPDDVSEDEAARRLAEAAMGSGLRLVGPYSGRANLLATGLGLLRVDPARLRRLNEQEGVTVATLRSHAPVRTGQVVATVKVIPYALPSATVAAAEATAREGSALLRVDLLPARSVTLLLSGSPPARDRVERDFVAPLRARLAALGSSLTAVEFVSLEDEAGEAALSEALQRAVNGGAGLILLAGETAIVDRHDIAPRALERAGGRVVCFGAPVDPGNLLLLGQLGPVPVLGAPGCARSPRDNVVDAVLPRLLAGDSLTHADVVELGHGGLLEDVPERGAPRSSSGD